MTVTAFGIRIAELGGRLDAGYALSALPTLGLGGVWPVERLGDLAVYVQYGSSSLASAEPVGVPMLRMNNLQDDGWDLSDLKFVSFSDTELAKYKLQLGDVLINRTNGTRELVGKSQVFREGGDWVFASYLIRMRFDTSRVLPEFVSAFLNSDVGRAQVSANSRQILQTNISATELKNLRLPLPPIAVQEQLVVAVRGALTARDERLKVAAEAIASIGPGFMRLLEIPEPPSTQPATYPIRLSSLMGGRFDASASRPIYAEGVKQFSGEVARVDELAAVDPRTPQTEVGSVPYVGLPQCDLLDVRNVIERPYGEVRARKAFMQGDLLFARIEPSVFNMKYPWARSPVLDGYAAVYTSTEFYIVRSGLDEMQAFLFAAFRSSYVQVQVAGRTTGSSGRRRLDRGLFSSLLIPRGTPDQQSEVAAFVTDCLSSADRLQKQAQAEWATAKRAFGEALSVRAPEALQ